MALLKEQPALVRQTAWTAQERLCRRYCQLIAHGKRPKPAQAGLTGFRRGTAPQVRVMLEQPHGQALLMPELSERRARDAKRDCGSDPRMED
ncbi:MAG: hypothetical protein AAF844_14140 [Pseudomonadota bacterium]